MIRARLMVLCLGLMTVACGKDGKTPNPPTTPTTPDTPNPPAVTNRAPVIDSMTVSPSFGVSGLTTISMNAAASDADADLLSYFWTFGGGTATGPSAAVKPTGDGPVVIQVTVGDGRGATATDSRTITLGTMTGSWDFVVPGLCGVDPRERPAVFLLTQTGTVITGSLTFPGNWCNANPGTHSEIPAVSPGSIDDQGNFTLPRVAIGAFQDVRFANGKMDNTGRRVVGALFNSGFNGQPFVLTKK
jgi:hypothetical protein